jgi:hypothetical protein
LVGDLGRGGRAFRRSARETPFSSDEGAADEAAAIGGSEEQFKQHFGENVAEQKAQEQLHHESCASSSCNSPPRIKRRAMSAVCSAARSVGECAAR